MRDFLIPLVLIVVVIAGVWIYFETTLTHAGPVASAGPATDIGVPPPPPKKVVPSPKRAIARSADLAAPPAPTLAPARVEERPAAPPPAPRPIPTGTLEQVNPGMDVSKVVELLGEPDLTALKINRGNLLETYVYKKKTSQNLAFIRLQGGRVVPPQ